MSWFKSLLFLIVFVQGSVAQKELNPFQVYGPFGSITYNSISDALKNSKEAFKLKSINEDWSKQLKKLNKLSGLYVLEIQSNNIDSLPFEFGEMRDLMYFKTSGNPLFYLPPSIGSMYSLRTMKLYHTALDSLPKEFNQLRALQSLEIQSNTADTLYTQKSFSGLVSLTNLMFYKTTLDHLPYGLEYNRKLTQVSFIDCGVTGLDSLFKLPEHIHTLILDNNQIDSFPPALFDYPSLRVLSLRNNQLTQLPEFIKDLRGLEVLDVRGNQISDYEATVLQILLPQCKILWDREVTLEE